MPKTKVTYKAVEYTSPTDNAEDTKIVRTCCNRNHRTPEGAYKCAGLPFIARLENGQDVGGISRRELDGGRTVWGF